MLHFIVFFASLVHSTVQMNHSIAIAGRKCNLYSRWSTHPANLQTVSNLSAGTLPTKKNLKSFKFLQFHFYTSVLLKY